MDAMVPAADAACVLDDVLPCETAAGAVRRKRIEIRRIRILANSADGLLKRSRIQLRGYEDGAANKKPKDSGISCEEDDLENHHHKPQQPHKQQEQQQDHQLLRATEEDVPTERNDQQQQHHQQLPVAGVCCSSVGQDACPPYGKVSVCGRRREMEDAVSVQPDFLTLPCTLGGCMICSGASISSSSYHFFGVYDGHGGSQAATFCQDRLHQVLIEEMNALTKQQQQQQDEQQLQEDLKDPSQLWEGALTNSFLKVDEQVRRPTCSGEECKHCKGNGCEIQIPETVGSTAIVGVVGSNHIIIANCGDCRAVLSRGGKAIPLSVDHKASRPDEMARVEAAGGQVINWDIPRILGILAMSRSIGDQFMTPFLIANPEVMCVPRSDEDECLILASDGLWDKVANETACDIVRKCLTGRRLRNGTRFSSAASNHQQHPAGAAAAAVTTTGSGTGTAAPAPAATGTGTGTGSEAEHEEETACSTAASLLLKIALQHGSKDNISVVVIDLKRPPSSSNSRKEGALL